MISFDLKNKIKKKIENKIKGSLVCETKLKIVFPKYQEKKIKESWQIIKKILSSFSINSRLEISFGFILIWTTKFTDDPFSIIKARDFLKLISRSVPVEQAAKIFEDEIYCEIFKISNFLKNRKVFLKRRRRLIGNKGITVRAIEMITQTYILVQGNSVAIMGNHSGLKQVRKIIKDCMNNIHPIFHIKNLIIKQQLSRDEFLKEKNWDQYLPLKEKENAFRLRSKKDSKLETKNKVILRNIIRLENLTETHSKIPYSKALEKNTLFDYKKKNNYILKKKHLLL
jgi:ribosomal RNA assembly protein